MLWEATNSPDDTIYELNPEDCTVLATLAHPSPGFNGAGIEMDEARAISGRSVRPEQGLLARQRRAGVLGRAVAASVTPTSGTLAAGRSKTLTVSVDTTGLTPGVYLASISSCARTRARGRLRMPVSLIVTATSKR